MMADPGTSPVKNVFVLMLENHSFDHLLGFSGVTGTDAETGQPTAINGLTGNESNSFNGTPFKVQPGADFSMPLDPGHEFPDVLMQLTGLSSYNPANGYPSINNSGFVKDYASAGGKEQDIMNCFSPQQLPVLNTLAKEFAVCDNWFSSLPGPTLPNRFFVHAATSGGLDHSPTNAQIELWETLSGMSFQNGTIFDQLRAKFDNPYRLYRGDNGFVTDLFPNVAELKGISSLEAHSMDDFAADLQDLSYNYPYTFIEPSYGNVSGNTYKGGSSMHPMDDATSGEALIKQVYEAIRKSPLWPQSLFILIWDEHGGFYDHVQPPKAIPPGDPELHEGMTAFGFDFSRYGVRVPAVIVSPLIPKGTIDHRLYDHSSVPATLEKQFKLKPMTKRDANANSVLPLLSLSTPRTDALTVLPNPANSGLALTTASTAANLALPASRGSLPLFLHAALKADVENTPGSKDAIHAEFKQINTRGEAEAYMEKVKAKIGK